jgi:hypothetical protein
MRQSSNKHKIGKREFWPVGLQAGIFPLKIAIHHPIPTLMRGLSFLIVFLDEFARSFPSPRQAGWTGQELQA